MLRSRDLSRFEDKETMAGSRGSSGTRSEGARGTLGGPVVGTGTLGGPGSAGTFVSNCVSAGVGSVGASGRRHGRGGGVEARDVADDKLGKSTHKQARGGASASLRGDYGNIALLLVLYTLQGVPMGLAAAIPLLLHERGASYAEQALFSLVSWPFSLKILWAPLVDSCYSQRLGRRRTWLLPIQVVCAILMISSSTRIDEFLGAAQSGEEGQRGSEGGQRPDRPQVPRLTAIFLVLYLLMATQDIAVDGWALTMLQRRNLGWASTCNSTGQTLGFTLSFVALFALNNVALSDRLRLFAVSYLSSGTSSEASDPLDKTRNHDANNFNKSASLSLGQPLLSLGGLMAFWGWVMAVTTAFVLFLKPEHSHPRNRVLAGGTDGKGDYGMASWRDRGVGGAEAGGGGDQPPEDSDGEGMEEEEEEEEERERLMGVGETYMAMGDIARLPAVLLLLVVLMTCKVGFAAADAVTSLKLQEKGVSKETLASIATFFTPVALCLPALVSKYTAGPRPLDPFLGAIPYRLATNLVLSAILVLIPARGGEHDTVLSGNEGGMSVGIWALLLVCLLAQQVLQTVMFVAQMSFFAKVSDPAIGGTYMTLLNTVANLGSKWPTTCALWLVHVLTVPGMLDGYHVLNVGCTLVGALWFVYMRKNVAYLDSLPAGSWCLATAHGVHAGGACLFFRVERQSTYAVEEGTHKVDAIV